MERTMGEVAKRRLDESIRLARGTIEGHALASYERLLAAVWSRSDLLSRRYRCGPAVNVALVALAMKSACFLRDPESFVPSGASPHEVLASLAEHLLADFPMPKPMTSAWVEGELGESLPSHEWYVRLGRGESVRRIGIPLALTRAMAHLFTQAPRHLTVIEALRWAEVTALGGTDALVAAVLASRLGRSLEHGELFRPLLELFVRLEVDPEHVGPIVDYVRAIKLEWREGFLDDGSFGLLPPPEPDFDLRGRTLASLLRRVDAWHVTVGRAPLTDTTWRPSRYAPFRLEEIVPKPRRDPGEHEREGELDDGEAHHDLRIFTITEVLSSFELAREGREMRHCVATYIGECIAGRASIWSLRVESKDGTRRLLTIEIDPRAGRMRQARRKCNARAGEKERALLAKWAAREGVVIPERAVL